jgi:hypothetical protein
MDEIVIEGMWWLPGSSEVPGVVRVESSDMSFRVDEQLEPLPVGEVAKVGPPSWVVHPIVLGRARDGRHVTLLAVGGQHRRGQHGSDEQQFTVGFVVVGRHLTADVFHEFVFEFDYLTAWSEPPAVTDRQGDGSELFSWDRVTLGKAEKGGDTLELMSGAIGEISSLVVDLEQRCWFVLRRAAGSSLDEAISEWIRPMQDLLTLSVGLPIRLTSLKVRLLDDDARDDAAVVHFQPFQVLNQSVSARSSLLSYTSPALFLRRGLTDQQSFEALVTLWLAVRDELRSSVVLLLSPYYTPFLYNEHRFSTTFQSAEAYAKKRFGGRQKSKPEHASRVNAVTDALAEANLSDDVVGWARRVLASRNDKPLTELIDELLTDSGSVGLAIRDADPETAHIVASDRGGLSHGGAAGRLDAKSRYWYAEALRLLMRARLLEEICIDRDVCAKQVRARSTFVQALMELRARAAEADALS